MHVTEKAEPRQRDAERIAKCASGDRDAFESLHEEHYRAVVRLAVAIVGDKEEGRDVAQEVFVRLLRLSPRWRPDARLATWLRRTTLNIALTTRRRVKRWWSRSGLHQPRAADPEHALALGEASAGVGARLALLSPRQRAVVTLHLDQGLEPSEIAHTLEISPNAARLALSKGLRALRAAVGPSVRDLMDGAGA